jgi:Zn-dependent protease with chaperone function
MRDLIEFEKLVFSCERLAERDPRGYRLRVFLLATLGFAFIATILLLSAGAGGWLIYDIVANHHIALVKIALFPTAIAWLLLRSLFVRIAPPEGVEITPESAPRLFARIDQARATLMAAPIHRVVVDLGGFNAGVVQVPSFGVLGPPRNHLVIGLPFLESVTVEEFDFVLGHELGHLSRKQTRFRNWIYRVRQAWPRILDAMSNGSRFMSGLFTRFLNWYAPFFNAYTFVLARANEYDADRAGAEVAGSAAAARALTATSVAHDYLEREFWPAFFREAGKQRQAPRDPCARSLRALREISPAFIESSMRRVLAQKTSLHDTHPCVVDRLQALGEMLRPPATSRDSASEVLLGDLRDRLIAEADAKWSEAIEERWASARERQEELARNIADYAGRVDALDESGLFEYALLIEEAEGADRARPFLDAALARRPDHAPSLLMRGRLRLADGGSDGARDIERGMELDASAREPGARMLAAYFLDRRDVARSLPFVEAVQEFDERRREAEAELSNVLPTDEFAPHDLCEEALERLRAALRDLPVASLWLARRKLRLSPDLANFVAVAAFHCWRKPTHEQLNAILEAMPQDAYNLVTVADTNGDVTRVVAATAGAHVYGKARRLRRLSDFLPEPAACAARAASGWASRNPLKVLAVLAVVVVLVSYAQFQHDPRARLAYAARLIDRGRPEAAEARLRDLLAEEAMLDDNRYPNIESRIRLSLAELLMAQSRADEARAVAAPTCRWMMPDELRDRREALGVCGPRAVREKAS